MLKTYISKKQCLALNIVFDDCFAVLCLALNIVYSYWEDIKKLY